jgi:hypothetical protein
MDSGDVLAQLASALPPDALIVDPISPEVLATTRLSGLRSAKRSD